MENQERELNRLSHDVYEVGISRLEASFTHLTGRKREIYEEKLGGCSVSVWKEAVEWIIDNRVERTMPSIGYIKNVVEKVQRQRAEYERLMEEREREEVGNAVDPFDPQTVDTAHLHASWERNSEAWDKFRSEHPYEAGRIEDDYVKLWPGSLEWGEKFHPALPGSLLWGFKQKPFETFTRDREYARSPHREVFEKNFEKA